MPAPTPTRTPTGEELFEILCDWHRCIEQIDPLNNSSSEPLCSDMTIERWANAEGLVSCSWSERWSWKHVASMFEFFGAEMTSSQWREALREPRVRTILELCNEVAPYARLARVPEVEILGSRCLAAGVFRHLERTLESKKVAVRLAPSLALTQLPDVAVSWINVEIVKLAPGVMPLGMGRHETESRLTKAVGNAAICFLLAAIVSFLAAPFLFGVMTAISLAFGMFGCARSCFRWFNDIAGEWRIEYPGMETVGDLCRAAAVRHRELCI